MTTWLGRRRGPRRRLKGVLLIGIAAIVATLSVTANASDTFRGLELDTVDSRFSIRGPRPVPRDLVIVSIDDATFDELRLRFQDWPRRFHARVLRNLARAGAGVIAYDVQFTEPSEDPAEDLALYEAAELARPVVFATTEVDPHGRTNVLGGDDNLRAIGARASQALLPNDPGGVIRRVPYALNNLKSLAVVTVEERRRRALPPAPVAWIDFVGPARSIPAIPFWRIYRNQFPAEAVRGRTVVVGPTAPSLQDVHPTSVADDDLMSGAEIQANAIDTVARGLPLRDLDAWWDVLASILLSVIAPLAALRLAALRVLLLALAAGSLFAVAAQAAFNEGWVLAVATPLLGLAASSVATLVVYYFTETRERRRLHSLFSRFVPEAVVDAVVARTGEDLRLGGVRLDATVLFCDLRGFTTFAEQLEAERVIEVLNQYLGEMSEAILDNGGTLVSYMGDGIMAVFGAPLESTDHAERAVAAAREMVEVRLPRFNAWLREAGLPSGFRMGVGINSGPVMSGNVGSERRLEYTTVGDTTNTAARLEGMTKGTGHQIFLSEATRAALRNPPADLIHVGEAAIRGRSATMQIWAIPQHASA